MRSKQMDVCSSRYTRVSRYIIVQVYNFHGRTMLQGVESQRSNLNLSFSRENVRRYLLHFSNLDLVIAFYYFPFLFIFLFFFFFWRNEKKTRNSPTPRKLLRNCRGDRQKIRETRKKKFISGLSVCQLFDDCQTPVAENFHCFLSRLLIPGCLDYEWWLEECTYVFPSRLTREG